MNVTQEQTTAKENLDLAITAFFKAMDPTTSEISEAQNWYVEDVEVNGATDLQIANYAYYHRTGTL